MNNSIIAGRYAKALLMVGQDKQCLDALKADMELLYATIKESADFAHILDNPVVKPHEKVNVMHDLLEKRVHAMTLNFIDMLIKNKREIMLPEIAHRFAELYDEYQGIKRAYIVSAIGLDQKEKDALQKQLNIWFQTNVQMTTEINPDLIGGFVLRVDDQQYDASVSSGLKRMRKKLKTGG